MPDPTPTTHRASDGLLAFALAALTIGLIMVCSAVELVPMVRPAQHALAAPPDTGDPAGAASARPLAASRPGPVPPSKPDWSRSMNQAPHPRRRVLSSVDPRDELLALAALQRRWGLPSESYASGTLGS